MQLACSDVLPGLGCDFVAQGDDASEVHAAMMAHESQVHSALTDGMRGDDMGRATEEIEDRILHLLSGK